MHACVNSYYSSYLQQQGERVNGILVLTTAEPSGFTTVMSYIYSSNIVLGAVVSLNKNSLQPNQIQN